MFIQFVYTKCRYKDSPKPLRALLLFLTNTPSINRIYLGVDLKVTMVYYEDS